MIYRYNAVMRLFIRNLALRASCVGMRQPPAEIPEDTRRDINSDMQQSLVELPFFWTIHISFYVGGFAGLILVGVIQTYFGDTIGTIAFFGVGLLFALVWYHIDTRFSDGLRRSVWLAHGVCPDCGYNLTGNTSGTCPECGAVVSTHTSSDAGAEKKL